MKIDIVIGAKYRDEGKGLVMEWLCMKHEGTVVALPQDGMAIIFSDCQLQICK